MYDLSSLENSDENSPEINPLIIIPSTNMVEEIRSDSKDARIVFSTQDGGLCCVRFENNVCIYLDTYLRMRLVGTSVCMYVK